MDLVTGRVTRALTDAEQARCELFIAAARVRSRQYGHNPDEPQWSATGAAFCCKNCFDGNAEAFIDGVTLEMVYHDAATRIRCTWQEKGGG